MASSPGYGTLPSSAASAGVSSSSSYAFGNFISRSKETDRSTIATRKPWRELAHLPSFSRPLSFGESLVRIKKNLDYFRVNYTMIVLAIVFLSLLWHPISLIVFIVVFVAWLFLYFFRGASLELFGRTVDDRVALAVLSAVTIVALLFTHVFMNLIVSLLIGAGIVLIHAASRSTDDLFLDELDADERGLQSVVGSMHSYTRI